MTVKVEIRNAALERVERVDDYTGLDCRVRSCDVGTWSISMPAQSRPAQALTYLGGIVVTRNGLPFTAGSPTHMEVTANKIEGGRIVETLTASGLDDNAILNRRLALPTPSGPPYGDYDDHSGKVETVARGFVDRNLGPSATDARRIAQLVLEPDLGRGPDVRGIPDRFAKLLPFLQSLVAGTGITFRVVQEGASLVLRFYVPQDRSADVVFGLDRGNLLSYKYATDVPAGNYFYAGGQGDLGARLIVEDGDDASIEAFGRTEAFLDERSAPDAAYLTQKIGAAKVDQSMSSTLSIEPVDGPDSRFGLDYNLDDYVSVRLRAPEGTDPEVILEPSLIVDRVSEIRLQVDSSKAGQETLTPVAASDGANLSGINFIQRFRQLGRSVTRLESR